MRLASEGFLAVAARATAEYADYAKEGRESLSSSFPRIWRIPRFNPRGGCAPTLFFAVGEQIGLLLCKDRKAGNFYVFSAFSAVELLRLGGVTPIESEQNGRIAFIRVYSWLN